MKGILPKSATRPSPAGTGGNSKPRSPESRTRILIHCGHLVPEDAPTEMAEAVRTWHREILVKSG